MKATLYKLRDSIYLHDMSKVESLLLRAEKP